MKSQSYTNLRTRSALDIENLDTMQYSPSLQISDNEDDRYVNKPKKFCRWRFNKKFLICAALFVACLLFIVYKNMNDAGSLSFRNISKYIDEEEEEDTTPADAKEFKLMIISDLDKKSRDSEDKKGKWNSILKRGTLTRDESGNFSIHWLEDQIISTGHNEAGRGMELSSLRAFNGKLYAMDDRTGIVFQIVKGPKSYPKYILMEGNGETDKGEKCEWSTVKDNKLYVGSFGKEYTNPDGSIKNRNNMWISTIDKEGRIEHEDWTSYYNAMRHAVGVDYPGYMIHEAINWSKIHHKWFILPRRVSKDAYDENTDERMGHNTLIICTEKFEQCDVKNVTPLTPTRGFSSFSFVPGSKDTIIAALKSEENEEQHTQNTYITVFTIDGKVLLEETEIPGNRKFEGLEFFAF
ncbi:hypothetical protein WA158_006814 [Blastocystis sp. Blastoise]